MPMPETSMHQDHRTVRRKYNVGAARQMRCMKTKPKPAGMQAPSENELRFRIPATDAAHIEPPLIRCQNVHSYHLRLQAAGIPGGRSVGERLAGDRNLAKPLRPLPATGALYKAPTAIRL